MNFDEMRFPPQIKRNLQALEFETPTPIQEQVIPAAREGRDVIGLAQTGTGKTAAFVLPMLERMLDGPRRQVRSLVLAPTRELAEQINNVVCDLSHHTGLHSVAVYGGTNMQRQMDALRRGVEIVVACPGRLLDHMTRHTINVSSVQYLVLDEADRMFDMGFLPDIRRILANIPKAQTLLLSATMPPPIRRLAHDILKDPVTIEVAASMPSATVSHAVYPVREHLKTRLLTSLLNSLKDKDSVLVFTRTKGRAEDVMQYLNDTGSSVGCLQGDMTQSDRQKVMDGFRAEQFQVLVATDIAARGIDVTTISHVINFDMPDTVDSYTHRIGRTGRAAKTGDAYTLATYEDEKMIRAIEQVLGQPVERRLLKDFDYQDNMAAMMASGQIAKHTAAARSGARNRRPSWSFSRKK